MGGGGFSFACCATAEDAEDAEDQLESILVS